MKKIVILCSLFGTLMLLYNCSSIKVVSDVDPNVDWSQFSTFEYYGWAEESDEILTRFDKERIEQSFGSEFASRGLELVDENADIIVTLFIVVKEKHTATAHTTHQMGGYGGVYGHGPGYGWGGGMSTTTISQYDYKEGTLICDVYDAKKEALIWEGIGTKTITEKPSKREQTIPKAVQAIMSKFPVSSKD